VDIQTGKGFDKHRKLWRAHCRRKNRNMHNPPATELWVERRKTGDAWIQEILFWILERAAEHREAQDGINGDDRIWRDKPETAQSRAFYMGSGSL